jgi:branched-chain amino acid transport system permease protein
VSPRLHHLVLHMTNRNLLWLASTLLAVLAAPFIPGYPAFILAQFIVLFVAVHALNILAGYNGQISLGNGAFFAIGAYVCALLVKNLGLPYPFAVAASTLVTSLAGVLLGFPALRLGGMYLALATFSVATAVPQILKFSPLEPFTGGVGGLMISAPRVPSWLSLNTDQWLLVVTAITAAMVLWIGDNVTRSASGRRIRAIKDNPLAAGACGVDVATYKVFVFGVTAGMTGTAGALSALLVQYVSPDSFTFMLSVTLLVGAVIGGLGSLTGSFVGAIFIQAVPGLVDEVSKTLTGAVFGITLILIMSLMPGGLAGASAVFRKRFFTRSRDAVR